MNEYKNVQIVDVTWKRALRIWLSLTWSSLFFGSLFCYVVGFVIGFIGGIVGENLTFFRTANIIINCIVGIAVGVWVTGLMFKKQFSDFRIALIAKE